MATIPIFDALGQGGAANDPSSPITWSHTTSGADRWIEVYVAYGKDITITAVTYDGVALALIDSIGSDNQPFNGGVFVYGLKAPSTGSNTVSVSFTKSGADANRVVRTVSKTYTNVDQTTPTADTSTNFGDSTTATVTVTSDATSMVSVGAVAGSDFTDNSEDNRTIINDNTNSFGGNSVTCTKDGETSTVVSYTVANDSWGIVGYSINGAEASGTIIPLVMNHLRNQGVS